MPNLGASRASAHDLELVALAASGERAAFGELVRRHGSAVRTLLRRMGAAAAVGDEASMAGFLMAFERISEFRGEGTFQTWVKGLATRVYIKRLARMGLVDLAQTPRDPPEVARAYSDPLDEALEGLPLSERLCVAACFGAGLSHAEVADALNTSTARVKTCVDGGVGRLMGRLLARSECDKGRVAQPMTDMGFHMDIERRFANAVSMPDAEFFSLRMADRLDRGWGFRQVLIGGLGLIGGLIGGAELLGSGLIGRATALRAQAEALIARLGDLRAVPHQISIRTSTEAEILWMSGLLAIVALALFAIRALRNL